MNMPDRPMTQPLEVDLTGRKTAPTDPLLDVQPVTLLDGLADELAEIVGGEVTFPAKTRPGYTVTFSVDVDGPQVAAMRQRAKDDSQPDGTNTFQWAAAVIATYCRAVSRQGQRIVDAGGSLVTFTHKDLQQILGVANHPVSPAAAAVKKFYGSDAAVMSTALALLKKAGYGEDVTEDPTPGSSTV
ncbi:MAG TPA: hypothetical protein VHT75_20360 [Acidimicrobiales bacterium]|jgi:hypothetical protein|nr:hypothetical protein [Acidimicrobiales bacterium]